MSDWPREIRLAARIDGQPLAGGWLEIEIPMSRKNSYTIPLGPADDRGKLAVSGPRLRALVQLVNDLFPMDYSGIDGWTGELRVIPVNQAAIRRLRRAQDLWQDTDFYPDDFEQQLTELELVFQAAQPTARLEVEIEALVDGAAQVHGVSVAARD